MGTRWSHNPAACNTHQMCGGNIIIIINYLTWLNSVQQINYSDQLFWAF